MGDKNESSRYYAGICYSFKNDQANLQKMISELTGFNTTTSLEYANDLKKYQK